MLRLENWTVYNGALLGHVFNHPNFADNTSVIVPIKFLNLDSGYATSKGCERVYNLGTPRNSDETVCAHYDIKEF